MITCNLCNKEFKRITSTHLKNHHNITMGEYMLKFPDAVIYSEEITAKIRQTKLARYGDPNYNNKEKHLATCITRYGSNYTNREKAKQTMVDKYGVEYTAQSELLYNKMSETNIRRYGKSNVFASDIIKDQIKQTNIERYGYYNPLNNPEIDKKARRTMLSKYGVEYTGQSDKLLSKMKATNKKKYDVDYFVQTKDCRYRNTKKKNIKSIYDDVYFDNENEQSIYDYCKRHNLEVESQIPINYNGHILYIDFKIEGKLYEEKSSFLLSGGFEKSDNFKSLPIDKKLQIYHDLDVTVITENKDYNITKLTEFKVNFLDIVKFKEDINL